VIDDERTEGEDQAAAEPEAPVSAPTDQAEEKPKRRRAAKAKAGEEPEEKPKRRRTAKAKADEEPDEKPKRRRAAEAQPAEEKPKRRRAAKAEAAEEKPKRRRAAKAGDDDTAEAKPRARRTAKKDEPEAEEKPASRPSTDEREDAPSPSRRSSAADAPVSPPGRRRAPARTRRQEAAANGRVVVRAKAKYVRSSARKARLVCDLIRGKSVDDARAILATTTRSVARDWSKLLESAVANAENNHELDGDDLRVFAVHADEGPTLKRYRPRAMGRATRIRKRTSHLSIQLTSKE
jgi:ribosomal protein L22